MDLAVSKLFKLVENFFEHLSFMYFQRNLLNNQIFINVLLVGIWKEGVERLLLFNLLFILSKDHTNFIYFESWL